MNKHWEHREEVKKDLMAIFERQEHECHYCPEENPNVNRHEIIFGNGRRKTSIEFGLMMWLCKAHHNEGLPISIHTNEQMQLKTKQAAQELFESVCMKYGYLQSEARDLFRLEFRKSYL